MSLQANWRRTSRRGPRFAYPIDTAQRQVRFLIASFAGIAGRIRNDCLPLHSEPFHIRFVNAPDVKWVNAGFWEPTLRRCCGRLSEHFFRRRILVLPSRTQTGLRWKFEATR